jgi:hypothetical protein
MNKFGIFKIDITTGKNVTIGFTAVSNPIKTGEILILEAQDITEAAEKASAMLKLFGVKTQSLMGDYETVLANFPDYFVGELKYSTADVYDTTSLAYRIYHFEPVK